jgi:hypothetical protein
VASQLLAYDSPLSRLSTNLSDREVIRYDAIAYSLELSWLAYRRLRQQLAGAIAADCAECRDQVSLPGIGGRGAHVRIFSDAWAFVDAIDRLRRLLENGRIGKIREISEFVSLSEPVRDIRNFIQHLEGQLETIYEQDAPVWGTLQYVSRHGHGPGAGQLQTGALSSGTVRLGLSFEVATIGPAHLDAEITDFDMTLVAPAAASATAPGLPARVHLPTLAGALPSIVRALETHITQLDAAVGGAAPDA